MGREFFLILMNLTDFLLTMRDDFFCMGRRRPKLIENFLTIELEIDLMGRTQLKIDISSHETCQNMSKDYKISTPQNVG